MELAFDWHVSLAAFITGPLLIRALDSQCFSLVRFLLPGSSKTNHSFVQNWQYEGDLYLIPFSSTWQPPSSTLLFSLYIEHLWFDLWKVFCREGAWDLNASWTELQSVIFTVQPFRGIWILPFLSLWETLQCESAFSGCVSVAGI